MAWVNMRQRCNNPNHPEYVRYGGRGIKVCQEWGTFQIFLKDMGPKPFPDLSLERKDNNLGYSADNCKWASKSTQSFNQRKGSDNKSGVVGVYFELQTENWKAYIRVEGKQITLGRFENFFDAVCSRKSAELRYYKEIIEKC